MPATLPVGGLTVASITLTAVVVGNAYYQKKQFYPSVVYITKSNPSLAAIYLLAFTFVLLLGKLLKKVFFGQLRGAEFEQLLERSFYAVTETCLAFTVFRDDFSPKFVSLFTVLLFLKAFHYLTDSRVDFMERSPVITMLFHIRVTSLLLLLMLLDFLLLNYSCLSTITQGATVQLVFGFEYAILLTVGFNIAVKYICHSIDLRSENPWENKAVYLLYTELLVGFVKVVLYLIFLFIMIRIHTFPLFIIRPMYLTVRSFKNALNDVIQSRRAIHNMNTLYPDASPEELSAVDNVCIICREEMVAGAKKLPCGHIFHSSCLRSWFQRQQTCPTCRMDILQQPVPLSANAGVTPQQQGAAAAAAGPQQPLDVNQQQPLVGDARLNQNIANNLFRPVFPFAQFPLNQIQQQLQQHFQQQTQQQQHQSQDQTGASGSATESGAAAAGTTSSPNAASPNLPGQRTAGFPFGPMPPPPFLPFMPFCVPPPQPPPNFDGLTLEELRKMEGNERSHVEARIKTLRNIHILLDAAAVQLSQYNSVVNSLEPITTTIPNPNPNPSPNQSSGDQKTESDVSESQTIKEENEIESSKVPSDLNEDEQGGAVAAAAAAEGEAVVDSASLSTKSKTSTELESQDNDIDPDDPNEIRRRRLEKFTSSSSAERESSSNNNNSNNNNNVNDLSS